MSAPRGCVRGDLAPRCARDRRSPRELALVRQEREVRVRHVVEVHDEIALVTATGRRLVRRRAHVARFDEQDLLLVALRALPRVMREARPVLLAAHPQLSSVDEDAEITAENVEAWLAAQIALFGETLPVPKLNQDHSARSLEENRPPMGQTPPTIKKNDLEGE